MSFSTKVEFADGKVYVEMPEEAADQRLVSVLRDTVTCYKREWITKQNNS